MAGKGKESRGRNSLRLQYSEPSSATATAVQVGVPNIPSAVVASPLGDGGIGVAYQRVSGRPQEDGTSIEKQLQSNLAAAARLGVHIPPEYVITETWSGADFGRPGFQRVRGLVGDGLVQHAFVYDTDRLARDPWHVVQFLRMCSERNVRVHFVDGTVGQTMLDEAMQYLRGLFGFQEREKIAERTMDGKRRTALQGRVPNGHGRGIYGYDDDPVTKTRSVNEEEAVIIRGMFLASLGGVSTNRIAKDLRQRGIRTKTGGRFEGRTVYHILQNETYTGEHWWGTRRYEKLPTTAGGGPKRRVTPKPEEEWIRIKDFSPMIVTPPVWKAVQKGLDSRRRRGALWDYEFSEFFVCGLCGSSVVGATQVRNGKKYPYYRCTGTLGDDYRPKICTLRSFRADKLEPVIWEHIRSIVRDPSGVIADLRSAAGDGGGDELDHRISSLQARVQRCRSEEGTLVMQRARGLIDQEMLEALIAPITNLRLQHEDEIALLLEQRALGENLDELEEHIREMFDHYSNGLDSLDREGRQRLLRLLDIRLTAGHGQVLVTGVLDPSLFTTGQTSESTSNWRYTVVLKPKADEWPPSRKKSRS